jgi:hypothetical protein
MIDTPPPSKNPSRYTNLAAGLMIVIGWGGVFYLVRDVVPDAGARWIFFVLLYIAVTGTALPFVGFLNHRFGERHLPDWVILRQSMWCGLYVTTCVWLQIPRVLNWTIALLMASIFIVIEIFVRLRERSLYIYLESDDSE